MVSITVLAVIASSSDEILMQETLYAYLYLL